MTNEFSIIALFVLGLFSAFHCIGMCGGVIGALTFSLDSAIRERKSRLAVYVAAYNLGRLISYSLAGLLVGYIGTTLVGLIGMDTAQGVTRGLSAIMLVAVGLYVAGWFPQMARLDSLGAKLWRKIQPLGQRFIPVKTPIHALGFGMVWGWLPCGLVYTALLLAALGGSAINGGLGMLAFGLGTLPAVMGAGLIAGGFSRWLQKPRIRQVFGSMMIGLGALTLWVPMNHADHAGHGMDHNQHDIHHHEIHH